MNAFSKWTTFIGIPSQRELLLKDPHLKVVHFEAQKGLLLKDSLSQRGPLLKESLVKGGFFYKKDFAPKGDKYFQVRMASLGYVATHLNIQYLYIVCFYININWRTWIFMCMFELWYETRVLYFI